MDKRKKIVNIMIILSSLLGYLEWGKDQHAFIFEVVIDLLFKKTASISAFLHPFILIPISGLIMLLITVFQKNVSRLLSILGLACLSSIMLLLFFIGLLFPSIKIICSTIPFIICGIISIRFHWRKKK